MILHAEMTLNLGEQMSILPYLIHPLIVDSLE
jgi:hypothetical protein